MLVRNIFRAARASSTHPGGRLHSLPRHSESGWAPSTGDNACAREGQTSAESLLQPIVHMRVKKTEWQGRFVVRRRVLLRLRRDRERGYKYLLPRNGRAESGRVGYCIVRFASTVRLSKRYRSILLLLHPSTPKLVLMTVHASDTGVSS